MKTPFKTVGGKIYIAPNGYMPKTLSYSGIRAYQTCPRDYYYKYVLGVQYDNYSPAFTFGRIMHSMLETHMKTSGDYDEVKSALETEIEKEGLEASLVAQALAKNKELTQDQLEKEILSWKKMLWGMYQNNRPHLAQWTPKATEQYFEIPLRNPDRPDEILPFRMRGFIDLVADGLIVVDHKTAQGFGDDKDWETSMQPYIYAMGCKQLYGEYPQEIAFNCLLKRKRDYNTKVVHIDFDYNRLSYVCREIVNTVQLMLLGEWQKGGANHYYFCDTCKSGI